jgi:hypothetical protein
MRKEGRMGRREEKEERKRREEEGGECVIAISKEEGGRRKAMGGKAKREGTRGYGREIFLKGSQARATMRTKD